MADDTTEKVLLEMGLDLSPLDKSAQALKDALSQLNALSDQFTSKVGSQQAAAVTKVKAATDALFTSTMKVVDAEAAKDVALKAQIASLEKQLVGGKEQIAQAEKRLALTEATAKAEAGIGSKLAQSIGGGLFGSTGSTIAGIMTGVVGGEIVFRGLEEGIKKLKEFVVESSKLTEVRASFDQAAKGKGVNPDDMITKMKVATEGQVGTLTLYKTALAGMTGPLKLNHNQIIQLVGDVEKLATANGKVPQEQALQRVSMQLGMGVLSARSMARSIGIAPPREAPVASGLGPQARQQATAGQGITEIHAMAQALGELPITAEMVQTRIHLALQDIQEEFGRGVTRSSGMQVFLNSLLGGAGQLDSMSDKAEKLGEKVGNFLGIIGTGLSGLLPVAHQVLKIFSDIGIAGSTVLGAGVGAFLGGPVGAIAGGIVGAGGGVAGRALAPSSDRQAIQLQQSAQITAAQTGDSSTALEGGTPSGDRQALQLQQSALKAAATKRPQGSTASGGGRPALSDAQAGTQFETLHPTLNSVVEALLAFDKMLIIATGVIELYAKKLGGLTSAHLADLVDEWGGPILGGLIGLGVATGIGMAALPAAAVTVGAAAIGKTAGATRESMRHGVNPLPFLLSGSSPPTREGELDEGANDPHRLARVVVGGAASAPTVTKHTPSTEDVIAGATSTIDALRNKLHQDYAAQDARARGENKPTVDQAGADVTNAMLREGLVAAAKAKEDADKADLERQEQHYAAMKALNDNNFKNHAISIQEHATQEQTLNDELAQHQIASLQKNFAAQEVIRKFDRDVQQKKTGGIDISVETAAETELGAAKLKIIAGNALKTVQINQGLTEDDLRAATIRAEGLLDIEKTGIEKRKAANDEGFKEATESFDEYLDNYKQGLTDMAAADIQSAVIAYASHEKTAASFQTLMAKLQEAQATHEKGLQALGLETPEKAVQYAKNAELPVSAAQAQLSLAKLPTEVRPAETLNQPEAYTGLIAAQQQKLTQLQATSDFLAGSGFALTPEFQTITQSILKTKEALAQTNEEFLTFTRSLTPDVADAISAVAGITGGGIGGRTGKAVESAFMGVGGLVKNTQAAATSFNAGQKDLAGTPQSVGMYGDTISTGGGDTTAAVGDFSKAVIAGAQALMSFVASIEKSTSAVGGALSGGIGGASMAASIPGAGAWGAAAGAVFGALVGVFIGSKNAAVTAQLNQFKTTFTDVMNNFSQNTNALTATVQQVSLLVAQTETAQAGSKKGSAQFQTLIDQYNAELVQLTTQQQTAIRNMQQQVAILTQPLGGGQALTTLQGIMNQYMQFAGAAQNATQLAEATQFLTLSLQQYETNIQSQLLGDQQQAIQDALQLNDLLFQQQQDLLQYNQQVQGILSAGVLSRQNTRAQTVGQQIYEAQLQFTRSQEDLDAQIQTEQFKVDAEQQIFNLATTRIGLENQLVSVQNAQTVLQMAQIASLQSVYAQLTTGGTVDPNSPLGALLAAIQSVQTILGIVTATGAFTSPGSYVAGTALPASVSTPGTYTPPATVAGQGAGLPGGSDEGGDLDAMVKAAYNNRASQGYGAFRGQNL